MIISLTNGTKIELSSSEMAELAKQSVDVFSPIAKTIAKKMGKVVTPAPKVKVVKRGRGRPRKNVPEMLPSRREGNYHKGGSIIDKVRKHYGDDSIRYESREYQREKQYYYNHGKKFSWEK